MRSSWKASFNKRSNVTPFCPLGYGNNEVHISSYAAVPSGESETAYQSTSVNKPIFLQSIKKKDRFLEGIDEAHFFFFAFFQAALRIRDSSRSSRAISMFLPLGLRGRFFILW
jgi:hypothetical protein